MESQILIIVLVNNLVLISKVEGIYAELGEADCKLLNPYLINSSLDFVPWLDQFSNSNEIQMSSDKILTMVEPKKSLLDKYLELTQ